MNKLDPIRQKAVIAALVEGNSIRATCRMTGVAKGTVLSLLARVGAACSEYQGKTLRNLPCKRVQVDEIWSFCYAKDKNVPKAMRKTKGIGDVWTWTAIDADTKLVPSWWIGDRGATSAKKFMEDLASRLANRVQLTSDGHKVYLNAVENAFAGDVDFSQLVKIYGNAPGGEGKYSPGECCGAVKERINGRPDPKHVSTSFVERQNLTMRMCMRRFTRLTNAFSKKVENLGHAVALHFMYYNFCRVHLSLRITPAMKAGVADHIWEIEEILALLDGNSN